MDPHFWWYVTRSAGIVTFGLVTFSTALGLGISARIGRGILERPWVYELHKFAALLSLAFLGMHITALLFDHWLSFSIGSLLVPGSAPYRPFATALGVLAMYGAVVATGSFYIKRLIGYKGWRAIHYTTFLTYVLVLAHGALAGTDSHAGWMELIYVASGLLIFSLLIYRFEVTPQTPSRDRPQRAWLFPRPVTRPPSGDRLAPGDAAATLRASQRS